ncbi:hypothetical protein QOT17_015206 [Balamuthia mandrillaris]
MELQNKAYDWIRYYEGRAPEPEKEVCLNNWLLEQKPVDTTIQREFDPFIFTNQSIFHVEERDFANYAEWEISFLSNISTPFVFVKTPLGCVVTHRDKSVSEDLCMLVRRGITNTKLDSYADVQIERYFDSLSTVIPNPGVAYQIAVEAAVHEINTMVLNTTWAINPGVYWASKSIIDQQSVLRVCESKTQSYTLFEWPNIYSANIRVTVPIIPNQSELVRFGMYASDCESIKIWPEVRQGLWFDDARPTPRRELKRWVNPYTYGDVFDFAKFAQTVKESIAEYQSLVSSSRLMCEFNPLIRSMERVSCLCNTNDKDSCFQQDDGSLPFFVDRLCPKDIKGHFNSFFDINLEAPENFECVATTGFYYYENQIMNSDPPLATFFNLVKEPHSLEVVRNSKGAIVGEVLGTGFRLNVQNSLATELQLKSLCFSKFASSPVNSEYNIFDIGWLSGDTVVPFGLQHNISFNANSLCIKDHTIRIEAGAFDSNHIYFPIIRLENYEDTSDELSSLELSIYAIFLELSQLFTKAASIVAVIAVSLLVVMALARGLYFALLAGEVITEADIQDYFLVTLPLLLFLFGWFTNINTIGKYSTVFVSSIVRDAWPNKLIYALWFTFCLVLLVVFCVTIILFETLTEEESRSCGGIGEDSSDDDAQQGVQLAFYILLFIVAIVIALSFGIFGGKIYVKVTVLKRKTKRKGQNKAHKLFIVTALGVVVFFAQSLLFLYLAIDGDSIESDQKSLFCIILWFIEVLPIGIMAQLLLPLPFKRTLLGSASTKDTSSGPTTSSLKSTSRSSRNSSSTTSLMASSTTQSSSLSLSHSSSLSADESSSLSSTYSSSFE